MKTIGLLGGMSWESSLEYYRIINQLVKERLGGLHSAKCLLYSVDFQEIESLQHRGLWDEAGRLLGEAARGLQKGGADFLLICTNTMHKVAPVVQQHISMPLLHIADPTAKSVLSRGIRKIGLLGTRFTMQEDFYKGKLVHDHGLEVLTPIDADMDMIHQVIFDELVLGLIKDISKGKYIAVIKRLEAAGAEGVILGCTEIGLLVKDQDSPIPLFDTTFIHAEAAVEYALTT
ncbi:MAG: aspartate racemase [Deltaproteobacteria bacterium]|nr:MAG: aspartate racemase [Deltaproteobacteria bacterium]RLC15251.1 MAG: aspartate racemase [Deltaproteobacteria bacterium]